MTLHNLVNTVIRLRNLTQAELAEKAGLHETNLSKILNGESDIRSSSLTRVLAVLGLHTESLIEAEIDRLVGRQKSVSTGEAFEILLRNTHPLAARTIVDTLVKHAERKDDPSIRSAIGIVGDFKAELSSIRRRA
jgi:transcriptional regulator with XRE-family HTH domain